MDDDWRGDVEQRRSAAWLALQLRSLGFRDSDIVMVVGTHDTIESAAAELAEMQLRALLLEQGETTGQVRELGEEPPPEEPVAGPRRPVATEGSRCRNRACPRWACIGHLYCCRHCRFHAERQIPGPPLHGRWCDEREARRAHRGA